MPPLCSRCTTCLACECSFSLAGSLTRVPADGPAEWAVHLLPGPFTKELSVPRRRRSLTEPQHLDLFNGADWKPQDVEGFLTRSPNLAQQTCLPSAKVRMTEMHVGIASPPHGTDNSTFFFYFLFIWNHLCRAMPTAFCQLIQLGLQ